MIRSNCLRNFGARAVFPRTERPHLAGADGLRLGGALSDWRSDVSIGEITISKVRSQRDHNPPRRSDQP